MPAKPARDTKSPATLAKEQRIEFVSDVPRSNWPSSHEKTLEAIEDLGQRKFDAYAVDNVTDDIEPWKLHVKSQAKLLTEKAKRQQHRNESSWRYACEHIVFARLEAEVACRKCRKRIWRAEIEPSRVGTSSAAEDLRRRKQNREPCRCPRAARSQDYLEAVGLNRIFGHREDEVVPLDPEVAKGLGQEFKKPDAIFGLRQTRNLENLLHDTRNRDLQLESESDTASRQLHELLSPSALTGPLGQEGDELLFPFLVLEAKAGNSTFEWEAIQLQTAFPIKTFLDTQNRLRRATGRRSKWQAGPLVWFFANRGKDWRLSAAYIEQEQLTGPNNGKPCYRIFELWRGSIDTRDGALQLLLLVDHIFAWARDIYREDIIRELRVLASGENDTASNIYSDTDIFSTRHQEEYSGVFDGEDNEKFQHYIALQKAYTDLDSDGAAIRNATFIENRYCCIYVTQDNVRTLLQPMQQTKAQLLCHLVMDQMSSSLLLDLPTLVGMEEQWTGNVRLSLSGHLQQMRFHCVVSSTNYLSEDWHQVRELYVIAIAEDAWDTILNASNPWENRCRASRPRLDGVVDRGLMATTLKRLLAGSTAETLLASITRRAVKIVLNPSDAIVSDKSSVVNNFSDPQGYNAALDDGLLRHIVQHIYDSFKRGNMEPQEPFIRASKRFDQQSLLQVDVKAIPAREEPLKVSDDGWVMVSSSCHAKDQARSKSTICLYQVEGALTIGDKENLLRKIVHTIETCDVYHTTQDNGPSNFDNGCSTGVPWHIPWNLQRTYGLFSGPFDYLALISKINSDIQRCIIPKTQGSMRESAKSGFHLLSRNLTPWKDPRQDLGDVAERSFVAFKILTNEISYWKERAIQRQSHESVPRCQLCQGIPEQDNAICKRCYRALDDSRVEQWLYDAIVSEPSLHGSADGGSYNYDPDYARKQDGLPEAFSGYPKLGEPFRDVVELLAQRKEFEKWLRQKRKAERREFGKKRKRKDGERGEEEGMTTDSNPDFSY